MTQPQPSWVEELIKKRYGNREAYESPRPISFEADRSPFDPSGYYEQLEQVKNINRTGTDILRQQLDTNRREMARRAQQMMPKTVAKGRQEIREGFGSPVAGRISSGYGHRKRPTKGATTFHRGIDFAAPEGTPIYATHDGVVVNSGWSDGYGHNVTISNQGGLESFYGHNSKNVVKSGQYVRRGDVIGYVGSTGVSTGPHLHYGVKINGQWVNPQGYL